MKRGLVAKVRRNVTAVWKIGQCLGSRRPACSMRRAEPEKERQ